MKLEDLFIVRNGIVSTGLSVYQMPGANLVPYLRPASTQHRTISGWVPESEVGSKNIYPEGTLFVSTNGEGSHSYSYVSRFKFACNSDVSVLLPKREMTLNEKVYYARCITMNRYKFSYGRKPKGDRLKKIELPDSVPAWVFSDVSDNQFLSLDNLKALSIESKSVTQPTRLKLVPISDLFNVYYGTNHEFNALELDKNGVNFVSRSAKNNGVAAKVKLLSETPPIQGGVLTVAGGGSVLETFLQLEPFYSGRDLFYLVPKDKMTVEELLYFASCIKANRFRYSYGRQANRTLKDIKVPSKCSVPSWVFGSLSRVVQRVELGLNA